MKNILEKIILTILSLPYLLWLLIIIGIGSLSLLFFTIIIGFEDEKRLKVIENRIKDLERNIAIIPLKALGICKNWDEFCQWSED